MHLLAKKTIDQSRYTTKGKIQTVLFMKCTPQITDLVKTTKRTIQVIMGNLVLTGSSLERTLESIGSPNGIEEDLISEVRVYER